MIHVTASWLGAVSVGRGHLCCAHHK